MDPGREAHVPKTSRAASAPKFCRITSDKSVDARMIALTRPVLLGTVLLCLAAHSPSEVVSAQGRGFTPQEKVPIPTPRSPVERIQLDGYRDAALGLQDPLTQIVRMRPGA